MARKKTTTKDETPARSVFYYVQHNPCEDGNDDCGGEWDLVRPGDPINENASAFEPDAYVGSFPSVWRAACHLSMHLRCLPEDIQQSSVEGNDDRVFLEYDIPRR